MRRSLLAGVLLIRVATNSNCVEKPSPKSASPLSVKSGFFALTTLCAKRGDFAYRP